MGTLSAMKNLPTPALVTRLCRPAAPYLLQVDRLILALALSVAAGGCAEDCAPDFPVTSGSAVYVSAKCGSAAGKGTQQEPYATPTQAAAAAKSGDTIVLGAGTYTVGISIVGGVNVLGGGSGKAIIAPSGSGGITVVGTGTSTIRGISVTGASGYGISAKDTALNLAEIAITKTKALADGSGGHGVQAQGGTAVSVEKGTISDNAGTGVLTVGVGTVSIVDPAFAPNASNADSTSIVDPAFSPQSIIANNDGGGVVIVDPAFSPGQNDAPKMPVQISATDIRGNKGFGLAVFGGGATITRSAIRDTKKATAADFADGIVLAGSDKQKQGALSVDVGSAVTGNGRAGLIAAAALAKVVIHGEVSANESGGVWVQGAGAVVQLTDKARLRKNGLLGAAATKGGRLELNGTRVEDTQPRKFAEPAGGMPEDVGDGIGAFNGASLLIKNARFSNNARAGVVASQPKLGGPFGIEVDISGSEFKGGQFGIVVNKGLAKSPSSAELKGTNKFDSVKQDVDQAGNLMVRASVCADQQQDAEACAPKQSAPSK